MKKLSLFLLIISCLISCGKDVIHVEARSEAIVNLDILLPTTQKNDTIGEKEILLRGKVINISNNNSPVSGAMIKVVGTDTPGNTSYSKSDGLYEILLPIVPEKNAETITLVFEVQKGDAKQHVLSELLKPEQIKLLGINNPSEYKVAYAGIMNVGWNRCGYTLQSDLPVSIE